MTLLYLSAIDPSQTLSIMVETFMETNTKNTHNQDREADEVSIKRIIYYVIALFRPYISIGFAAPFVAGAIFAYISFPGHSTLPPLFDLIIPVLVGFLMGCGFFALDSYFDVETDKLNPRQKSLPHIFDKDLLPKWVGVVCAVIFFTVGIILSAFVSFFHIFLAIFGVGAGILYTTPPFRFKGRMGLDLFINVFAFGIVGSIYGWLIYSDLLSLGSMFGWFVVPLSSILTFIIVFPTPMIDYDADKAANLKSTVVSMGLKNYTRFGLGAISLIFITMTSIELKIYFDFLSVSWINFDLPFLIGLLLIGVLTFVSYFLLYRWPTPRTAFYITGVTAIIIGIGCVVALQIAGVFNFF